MSSDSRESYSRSYSARVTPTEHKKRIETARGLVTERAKAPRTVRDERTIIDHSFSRMQITRPKKGVKRVHVVLVDNSGSNRNIADHLKKSSGYLTAVMQAIDPTSQVATIYFSDHGDGDGLMQEIDFISPDAEGDKVLASSISRIRDASGADEPEAIECALVRACEIDFGEAEEKHLYLVTDVVAHGMGMSSDDGCPHQQDWRRSLKKVKGNYTSFQVIGCGDDSDIMELQKQFLDSDRVKWDLIDLSSVKEVRHRQAITGNALLFLMARHTGKQTIQMFLGRLFEKWLSEPVFGDDTDRRAREMIRRFGKYVELPAVEVEEMMKEILVE